MRARKTDRDCWCCCCCYDVCSPSRLKKDIEEEKERDRDTHSPLSEKLTAAPGGSAVFGDDAASAATDQRLLLFLV